MIYKQIKGYKRGHLGVDPVADRGRRKRRQSWADLMAVSWVLINKPKIS